MIGAGAAAVAGAICAAAMAAIVVIDIRSRTIPRGLCRLLAGAGCVLRFCRQGLSGIAAGALWAAVILAAACACAAIVRRRHGGEGEPIGGGDIRCMAALSLATGPGAPVGFAACFGCAAIWAAIARIRKRLPPGEPFPFAPFLALWLVFGMLAAS